VSDARIPLAALRDPVVLVATGFGVGCLRPGPGTWGTLLGVPLALGLATLPLWSALVALVVLAAAGVLLCTAAGERLGVHDSGGVVFDEIVGYALAVVWFPAEPLVLVTGFLWFRVLDIAKPWPVSWADRSLPGGLGVMADDLVAGALAAVASAGSLALLVG
jgi:phosphatidylglycerophosphatase A